MRTSHFITSRNCDEPQLRTAPWAHTLDTKSQQPLDLLPQKASAAATANGGGLGFLPHHERKTSRLEEISPSGFEPTISSQTEDTNTQNSRTLRAYKYELCTYSFVIYVYVYIHIFRLAVLFWLVQKSDSNQFTVNERGSLELLCRYVSITVDMACKSSITTTTTRTSFSFPMENKPFNLYSIQRNFRVHFKGTKLIISVNILPRKEEAPGLYPWISFLRKSGAPSLYLCISFLEKRREAYNYAYA